MGQRLVDSTHKWNREQVCKGCGCHLSEDKAKQPCEKPYTPRPRQHGEPWKT